MFYRLATLLVFLFCLCGVMRATPRELTSNEKLEFTRRELLAEIKVEGKEDKAA